METLGELEYGTMTKIKVLASQDPSWPIKLVKLGPSTVSVPICADGLMPFVKALLDASNERPSQRRFGRHLVGKIKCSRDIRPVSHSIYRTGHPTRPVRIVHRKKYLLWAWIYRLTEHEAIWMAGTISDRFGDGH